MEGLLDSLAVKRRQHRGGSAACLTKYYADHGAGRAGMGYDHARAGPVRAGLRWAGLGLAGLRWLSKASLARLGVSRQPLLTIRNRVIFPNAFLRLSIAREQSVLGPRLPQQQSTGSSQTVSQPASQPAIEFRHDRWHSWSSQQQPSS